jgi:hypothetical protein
MLEEIANTSQFVRQAASNNNNIISGNNYQVEYQNLNENQKKFSRESKITIKIPFQSNELNH